MAISTQCPQCCKSYSVRDDLAGKHVKCECGRAYVAPARRSSKDSGMSSLVLTAIIGGAAAVVLFIGLMIYLMSSPKDRTEALSGFAAPEEAFGALQKATVDKDWAAHLAVHAPESRDGLVGSVYLYATLQVAQAPDLSPEIVEILQKHGIDDSVSVRQPLTTPTDNIKGMLQAMEKEQRKRIKDKSAFYVELMTVLETVCAETPSRLPGMIWPHEKAEQVRKAWAEAKLIDLRITGDTAEGKLQIPFPGRTLDVLPAHFRRIDQRWYIHQPTAREAMEMGREIGQAIRERMGQGNGPANAP